MSAIAAIPAADQSQAVRTALKTSLYPGASDDSVDMVLAYCRAGNLDPLTKPVHIVPVWIPEKKSGGKVVTQAGMRDVVMPGIELYRTKAHRTGEYAGQDEAEYGPTVTASLSGAEMQFPEWCRVTVYRMAGGQRVPFSARVYWREAYATAGRDTLAPNAMWRKRPFGQLEKCAEALALRKAFPEETGGQPTAEEMEGRALDIQTIEPAAITGPRRRSDIASPPSSIPHPESSSPADETLDDARAAAAEFEEEPEAPAAPAAVALNDGQARILRAALAKAGKDEAALLAEFGSVGPAQLGAALAWCRQ